LWINIQLVLMGSSLVLIWRIWQSDQVSLREYQYNIFYPMKFLYTRLLSSKGIRLVRTLIVIMLSQWKLPQVSTTKSKGDTIKFISWVRIKTSSMDSKPWWMISSYLSTCVKNFYEFILFRGIWFSIIHDLRNISFNFRGYFLKYQ
jgi:hypothetical protein